MARAGLLSAVHFDNHPEAMHLLQQGYQPNGKTNVTTSPLYLAVEHKDIQMCKLLLEYNADVNGCDSDSQSSLFTSTESKLSYQLFELLPASGGKVGMFDTFERKPQISRIVMAWVCFIWPLCMTFILLN